MREEVSVDGRPPRRLSSLDWSILVVHTALAAGIGVVGFLGADDPGWGDLQRVVVLMLVGLWGVGILASALVARPIHNPWVRTAILLAGPFLPAVAVIGGISRW